MIAATLIGGGAFADDTTQSAPRPAGAVMAGGHMSGTIIDQGEVLRQRFAAMIEAIPDLGSLGPALMAHLSEGGDGAGVGPVALLALLVFGAAVAAEGLFRLLVRRVWHRPARPTPASFGGKLTYLSIRALFELVCIAVFLLGAGSAYLSFEQGGEAARGAIVGLFVSVLVVRLFAVVSAFLFSPEEAGLRLMPLEDDYARRFHATLLVVVATMAAGGFAGWLREMLALPLGLDFLVSLLIMWLAIAVWVAVVLSNRVWIADLLTPGEKGGRSEGGPPPGRIAEVLARNWHLLAILYLAGMGIAGTVVKLLTGHSVLVPVVITMLIFIGAPLLDWIVRSAVAGMMKQSNMDHRQSAGLSAAPSYGPVIVRNLHILIAAAAVLLLAKVWDVDVHTMAMESVGERFGEAVLHILITVLIASVAWQVIKIAINRHVPPETLDPLAAIEGEGMGQGRTRAETLLPLLKNFLFISIFVIAAMVILASLGVNVGPLLAGAGVVGLAVGFGAQTLVRDIFSGIFFLIDDSFRVGEYIDVGGAKGTVEGISIRSLRLRHQLGQIHTVPFGEIKQLTNFSRDWTIMKLELRLPFDTDLEQVRKIVKKVGQELLADEEMGPQFLQPLKSQGIHHLEDSCLIVRVKFMAKPTGEQFVIRREVFRRLQEAFAKSGIRFAPRRVIVDAPPGLTAPAAAAALVEDDKPGPEKAA
jgi:small-conductance mechanosensitive channel